ncbi:MAG: hypothetical protein LUH50_03305 [Bacteroides intestinalis]|nr:hypothetical protein [Bacteroides intestinalis]
MNEEQKDKGLKRAIKEENGFRLPSNFAYRTMRKVEEAIRLREKKSERRTLFATITASIFLIGCCIAGLIIYFGDTLREAFTRTEMVETEQIQIPSFCLLIFIAIPLFVLFDRWMRKRYYKHHS